MGSQCRSVVDAFVNALLPPDIQCPNGRQARSRTHVRPIYRWAKDTGHLEITGGMGQSDSLASSRRPDVPTGALRAATGAMDLTEKIGSRLEGNLPGLASGWPRRSRLGTSRLFLLGPSRIAQVWRRVVQSVGDALVLCAGLTR